MLIHVHVCVYMNIGMCQEGGREGGRGGRGTEGERERAREKETETKYEGVIITRIPRLRRITRVYTLVSETLIALFKRCLRLLPGR